MAETKPPAEPVEADRFVTLVPEGWTERADRLLAEIARIKVEREQAERMAFMKEEE